MDHLVSRLPHADCPTSTLNVVQNGTTVCQNGEYVIVDEQTGSCESTVTAVLSVIYTVTVKSSDFTRIFLEKDGVRRLIYLSNSTQYGCRVAKYASQVSCYYVAKKIDLLV